MKSICEFYINCDGGLSFLYEKLAFPLLPGVLRLNSTVISTLYFNVSFLPLTFLGSCAIFWNFL